MALKATRFPYQPNRSRYVDGILPYLPFNLVNQTNTKPVIGLVDSGSTVNVLPYSIGVELGVVWEMQTNKLELSGNLAAIDRRGLVLTANIGSFLPVRLAFAWAHSDNVPLILGQMNFFQEFEVCFLRTQFAFEIKPHNVNQN